MKRILAILLSAVLLLGAVPCVMADEGTVAALLNETFVDTMTNAVPNSAATFGDGSLVQVIKNNGGKILRVRNRWESALVHFSFSIGANLEIVIENRVMVEDNNSEKELLQYANGSNRFTLVTRKENGELVDMGGKKIGKMPTNQWMVFSAVLNLETLRYELYVDGVLKSHRGVLRDPKEMTKVGFTSKNNAEQETTMYCDYFRVYAGTEPVSSDRFAEAVYNTAEKQTRVEHATEPKYKPSLIFELDCETQAVGQGINGMPVWNGTAGVTLDPDDGNQFFRMKYERGSGAMVGAYSMIESYPCMVVQMDVRVNRKSRVEWQIICRDAAANGHDLRIIRVNAAGKFLAADESTVISDKSTRDGWVNIAAVIDFRTKDIDYYIDGELALENFSYADITTASANEVSSTIWEVRWQSPTAGATGEHYLDFDNVLFYKAIAPVDKDTLMGGGTAMEETGDTIDYELDSSALNPDMKGFHAVSEAISVEKNPSSYLTDYSKTKETYKDAICVVAENSNVWVKNGKYSSDYKFIWDGAHILGPAPTLAAFWNKQLSYDAGSKTATIGNLTAKAGDKFITVDGKEYASESKVQEIDGILYIPVREFARYGMHKFYGESSKGFGVIAPDERPYHFNGNPGGGALLYSVSDYSHMMAYLILDRYNADTIQQKFDQHIKNKPYPRVQTIKTEAPQIKAATETDPRMKEFSDLTLRDAKAMLNQTLNIPDTPGVQINGLPGTFVPQQLWYAYYMTGDRAYIDKIKEFANYLINLQYWNGEVHMLSTSWICLYLAYTYDLLRDELTQDEKDAIVYACTNKAIKIHNQYMYGTKWNDWPLRDFNWNVICNTGPMLAAMIFLGEGYDDALFLDTIEKSQVSLGYFMQYFAPDGGGWESMGYTNYLLSYMTLLLDGVCVYFDEDLGLLKYPGLDKVGNFLVNATARDHSWTIHNDTDTVPACTALSMWFTKHFKDYEGQQRNIDQLYKNMPQYNINGFTMMKNYMPNPPQVSYSPDLDIVYRGLELGASRDAWGDGQQTFMGVHGGYNNDAGSQLDLGNFFFEANGKIFADDTGREDYSIQGSKYAERAEGHNLWVVNPDESGGQNKIARGVVKLIDNKPKGVIYNIDLLPAYYGMVESAKRGYMLSDDRKIFTVQDEIKPYEGINEFYWFWHTPSEIEIDEENKMVMLTQDGKKCAVYFDSNVDFTITKQDHLEPLPRSPKITGQLQQRQAKKQKKIVINFFSEGEAVTFRAVAVPYGQKWERTELVPMSEWSIPDGSTTEGYNNAEAIYLNGVPVENFRSDVYDYTMYYPAYYGTPEVKVDTQGKVAEIIQPTEDNNTLVIRIESATVPGNFRTYTITLQSDACVGLPEGGEQIPIVNVEASDSDGNVPAGAIDGDMNTRWSSANDQWITFDLGERKEFNTYAMVLYGGDGRKLDYEIWVSDDNENFTLVRDNLLSSGALSGWEYTQFGKVKARYIKLTCHGSTIVPYNSIVEAAIYNVPER